MIANNGINTDSGSQSSFVALVSAAGYGGRYKCRANHRSQS
jgi:hypothetical protein